MLIVPAEGASTSTVPTLANPMASHPNLNFYWDARTTGTPGVAGQAYPTLVSTAGGGAISFSSATGAIWDGPQGGPQIGSLVWNDEVPYYRSDQILQTGNGDWTIAMGWQSSPDLTFRFALGIGGTANDTGAIVGDHGISETLTVNAGSSALFGPTSFFQATLKPGMLVRTPGGQLKTVATVTDQNNATITGTWDATETNIRITPMSIRYFSQSSALTVLMLPVPGLTALYTSPNIVRIGYALSWVGATRTLTASACVNNGAIVSDSTVMPNNLNLPTTGTERMKLGKIPSNFGNQTGKRQYHLATANAALSSTQLIDVVNWLKTVYH